MPRPRSRTHCRKDQESLAGYAVRRSASRSSRWLNDRRIATAALSVIEDEIADSAYRYRALEIVATQLSPTLSTTIYYKEVPLRDLKDPTKNHRTTMMATGSVGMQPAFVEGKDLLTQ